MANTLYNPSIVAGSTYQRAFSVYIDNPLSGTPSIAFAEEKVIVLDGVEPIHTQLGVNLSTTFDSTNPDHAQLYTLLNTVYTTLREARDAAPIIVAPVI